MMKVNFLFALIILSLISCKDQKKQEHKTKSETIAISTRCYSYSENKDSIYMQITNINDSLVEGNLTYKLFEKDRNQGDFKGKWKGDSLFAAYEFNSEGRVSTREIFFYKSASGLIEGYGPVKDTLNKVIFQDHGTLVLNEKILLKPVDCD